MQPHVVNVHTGVLQLGEETFTCMRHFVLSGPGQVHDVHTKLRLQHPRGEATQLHKCIVSAPSGEPLDKCSQASGFLASASWKSVHSSQGSTASMAYLLLQAAACSMAM
jgi:hypothetical protein